MEYAEDTECSESFLSEYDSLSPQELRLRGEQRYKANSGYRRAVALANLTKWALSHRAGTWWEAGSEPSSGSVRRYARHSHRYNQRWERQWVAERLLRYAGL